MPPAIGPVLDARPAVPGQNLGTGKAGSRRYIDRGRQVKMSGFNGKSISTGRYNNRLLPQAQLIIVSTETALTIGTSDYVYNECPRSESNRHWGPF